MAPSRGDTHASLSVRLWRRVEIGGEDDCWPWVGWRHRQGYGQIQSGGKKGKMIYTHRVAYMVSVGSIPDGVLVCHSCDNPPCCNPNHLFLGSPSDNVMDSVQKGRWNPPRGPITLFPRECNHCGSTYKPNRGTQIYCSVRCRNIVNSPKATLARWGNHG